MGTSISYEEETVFQFIRSIYDGVIIRGDRSIIRPQEIDILLPDLKLGIEYDGLRYHSELEGKDRHYHLNKTETAEQNGYSLLHIFSDEWLNFITRLIWESMLRAKVGMITEKIYARECILKSIEYGEAKVFFDTNHLAGSIRAKVYLGLFKDNELVSALCYGPSRFLKDEIEIYRFASKMNIVVIGAMGKLLSVVPKDNLVSFADRRFSSTFASSYNKFFNTREAIAPSWYGFDVKTHDLHHRWYFTKEKMKILFENYDETKTVSENMFANGYDRIWDCGNWKYSNS